jgi:tetratricopeptide (TPR) repeat protein
VRHFAGRTAELAALTRLLEETAGPGATVVISAIDGTAGIGKTALAVHFAHLVADRFPDGQLYVNLRGFGPAASPVQPAEAIREFLGAFGLDPRQIPAGVGAQAGMYRSLLAGKRVLVVLDNARDAGQVRPLLPGGPGCLVLVTSRSALTPLVAAEDAHSLTLDLLPVGEARELVTRRLGAGQAGASPQVSDELIELCARLPLALSITAARVAARPGMPLAAIAAELRDARGRLGALDAGDPATSVRTVFSWSYDLLSAQAARMFRMLSLHPGASISAAAAASVAAFPAGQARQVLRELCHAHLISESFPGRYSFHDLLRAYAAERAAACDSAADRQDATQRMLDYYLHTAHAAALLLTPARRPLTLPSPQDGVVPDGLADTEQALAWFEAEYRYALAASGRAAEEGCDAHAWQIPWALSRFFDRRGLWREWAASERVALAAAQRLCDPTGEAATYHELGTALMRLGEYSQADACLHRSAEMHGKLGDQGQQARVHYTLGMACEIQGRPGEALGHAQRALLLARAAGDRAFQPYPLNGIGYFQAQLGNYEQTITCCQEALTLHKECGNPYGEADTLDSLGYAYYHLGRHAEAIDCYTRALGMYRRFGDRWSAVTALDHLGDTMQADGNPQAAREAWDQALTVLDDLRHARAAEIRNKLSSLSPPRATQPGRG